MTVDRNAPEVSFGAERTWKTTLALIKADLRRRLELEGKPVTLFGAVRQATGKGSLSVVAYRLSTWLSLNRRTVLAKMIDMAQYAYTGIEIHVGSKIGGGLVICDQKGVGIPKFAVIGKNCTFLGAASLTLGAMENVDLTRDRIVMGDHCVVGVGTRILGAVSLADGTQTKPNAVVVVSSSVPGAILAGVPARRRGTVSLASVVDWNPLAHQARTPVQRFIEAERNSAFVSTEAGLDLGSASPSYDVSAKTSLGRPSWSQTVTLMRSDIAFRCAYDLMPWTRWNALRMLRDPGTRSVLRYRLQCFFLSTPGLGWLGRAFKFTNLFLYDIVIDERARIGGGLCILHPISIRVLGDVSIGERCILHHHNTISRSPFCEPDAVAGTVAIGTDVTFGGAACAYGAISVGDGCLIGANTVVDRSFPPGSLLFGIPARTFERAVAARAYA